MEIILLRHGKPARLPTSAITGRDIGAFCRQYNSLGISSALPPPPAALALAAQAGCVVSSDLKRSVESARWLAPSRAIEIDPDLREAALPEAIGVPLRLPPGAWLAIARAAWWLNCCRAQESLAETRMRAGRAADRLCALASSHGAVLAVGHGFFNRLIAAELSGRRWRGPTILPHGYWSAAKFYATF